MASPVCSDPLYFSRVPSTGVARVFPTALLDGARSFVDALNFMRKRIGSKYREIGRGRSGTVFSFGDMMALKSTLADDYGGVLTDVLEGRLLNFISRALLDGGVLPNYLAVSGFALSSLKLSPSGFFVPGLSTQRVHIFMERTHSDMRHELMKLMRTEDADLAQGAVNIAIALIAQALIAYATLALYRVCNNDSKAANVLIRKTAPEAAYLVRTIDGDVLEFACRGRLAVLADFGVGQARLWSNDPRLQEDRCLGAYYYAERNMYFEDKRPVAYTMTETFDAASGPVLTNPLMYGGLHWFERDCAGLLNSVRGITRHPDALRVPASAVFDFVTTMASELSAAQCTTPEEFYRETCRQLVRTGAVHKKTRVNETTPCYAVPPLSVRLVERERLTRALNERPVCDKFVCAFETSANVAAL